MPVVINGHHRLRAMHNNIFLQLPERKIALQGMLNRAHASYQQEGEAMHNNIFLQLDNKARECKATVFPVGHTHNDIDQIFSGKGSRTYMYKHRRYARNALAKNVPSASKPTIVAASVRNLTGASTSYAV